MARLFLLTLFLVALSGHVRAGILTSGALSVSFRSNGAIDSAVFNGVNFFKPGAGTDVSNFGIQDDIYTSTFLTNRTDGTTGISLAETGFTYSGNQSWSSSANLAYRRTYSLVSGLNALRVATTVSNIGTGSFTISGFDTFDPDQAYGLPIDPLSTMPALAPFQTYNDVFSLAGGRVGQSRINTGGSQLTMLVGSIDSRAVVASGGPLRIGSGSDLNKFFSNPVDGNDSLSDKGTHIGFRQLLNPNESTTFTYLMTFGLNPGDAQQAFTLASVPEPASIAIFGAVGICGLLLRRRSRRG